MGVTHSQKIYNDNPLVQPIHTAVKGRARYKVNGLYRSESLKKYIEFRLSEEIGIKEVHANPDTGNVLVLFSSSFSPNTIASLIQEIVSAYRKQRQQSLVTTPYINTATDEVRPINNRNSHQFTAAQEQKNAVLVATAKDIAMDNSQNTVDEPILPGIPIQKPLDKPGRQLILISGTAVSTLVLITALLHRCGLDEIILLAIQRIHNPLLDRIMMTITSLGGSRGLLWIGLAAGAIPLYNNRRAEATTLGITALGASSLNYLLKERFGRARPALWDRIVHVGHHSFPSGHAMMSMAVYGFIGYSLAKQFPQRRGQIFALTILLIGVIGFSRLYLGVHWPTDVVAGYAAGLMWLIICLLGLDFWKQTHANQQLELLAQS